MASQNNTGRQFDKVHAVTIVAQGAIAANRFVTYGGLQASATLTDGSFFAQGVSEEDATTGDALSIVTGYSYLVESAANLKVGDLVKPDLDGRAVLGSDAEHCGRVLGGGDGSGTAKPLIEVQILPHVKVTALAT